MITSFFADNFEKCPYKPIGYGKWELYIPPNQDGTCPIPHLTELKVRHAMFFVYQYFQSEMLLDFIP